jgi:hypothetical protein
MPVRNPLLKTISKPHDVIIMRLAFTALKMTGLFSMVTDASFETSESLSLQYPNTKPFFNVSLLVLETAP